MTLYCHLLPGIGPDRIRFSNGDQDITDFVSIIDHSTVIYGAATFRMDPEIFRQWPRPRMYPMHDARGNFVAGNYRIIHQQIDQDPTSASIVVVLAATVPAENAHRPNPPVRWRYEDHTDVENEAYNLDCDGDEERAAIDLALRRAGICLRPETAPSDYSPTGRFCWNYPTLELNALGRIITITQTGFIDC